MIHGSQLAQVSHVCFTFASDHPDTTKKWMAESNYICILKAKNEQALASLLNKAIESNITFSIFEEADLGNQITAIAWEPGEQTKKLCKKLKLA